MRDADILRKYGSLDSIVLAGIRLPPGTCSGCGKVHPYPPNDRVMALTAKGWREARRARTEARR
jgi:hypothetical protein